MKQIKITKISEIIPLLDGGKRTLIEVGKMITPQVSKSTMWRWARELRKAGFEVPTRKGKRKLAL